MSYSSPSNGSPLQAASTSRYRILCRRADGSVGLVRFCLRLADASRIAKSLANRHLDKMRSDCLSVLLDNSRPREVYVERWTGTLLDGRWEIVDRSVGGYRFEFFDRPPRKPGKGNRADKSEKDGRALRAGDVIECVLLEKRTRKNGWFARLVDRSESGPVTGVAPAGKNLEPGLPVMLKLCGIKPDTGFVQFAWAANLEK